MHFLLYVTLQYTATRYNTLQHTVTHQMLQAAKEKEDASHYNTLQHAIIHCNTLQHTATHLMLQAAKEKEEELTLAAATRAECVCWIDALNRSGSAVSDVYGASLGVCLCVCVSVCLCVCVSVCLCVCGVLCVLD